MLFRSYSGTLKARCGAAASGKLLEGAEITFLKDGQKRYLSMIQPWGKEGIWVPAEAKEVK